MSSSTSEIDVHRPTLRSDQTRWWHFLAAPDRLFMAELGRSRWVRWWLVAIVGRVVFGLLLVSTGIPGREAELRTQQSLDSMGLLLAGDPDQLRRREASMLENWPERLRFARGTAAAYWCVARPVLLLAALTAVSAALFVGVAAAGRATDLALLATIAGIAALVEIPQHLLWLVLARSLGVATPELSAAAWAPVPGTSLAVFLLLRRLNPFHLWYWALVAIGLESTGQVRRRMAVLMSAGLWLLAAVLGMLLDLPSVIDFESLMLMRR